MNGSIFEGFAYFGKGIRLISQPGMRLFLIIPVIVNAILFAALFMWAKTILSGWVTEATSWLPDWLSFLEWFVWVAYLLIAAIVFAYSFVSCANLIGAPFYGYLAELAVQKINPSAQASPMGLKDFFALIPRTLIRELQKIAYYLPRVLLLFIIGFIPLIGVIVIVLGVLFSAWMMSIQYVDYPADNQGIKFKELIAWLKKRRLTALGFGLVVFGTTFIPIINLIALPAAVCGACYLWEEERFDKANRNHDRLQEESHISIDSPRVDS